jgi:predicted ArsR family transcriptional regulator
MPDHPASGSGGESIEDRLVRLVRAKGPCSISTIADEVVISERHTRRLLQQLADEGRIQIEECPGQHTYKP